MKRFLLSALLFALLPIAVQATTVIGFEGVNAVYPTASYANIQNFYNGGTSSQGTTGNSYAMNFGISFAPNAVAVCLNALGGSCSNASRGGLSATSSEGALGIGSGGATYFNIPAGFTFALGFSYAVDPTAPPATIQAFSGPSGTGAPLSAPLVLLPAATGCAAYNATLCTLGPGGLTFSGTAYSIVFTGQPGKVVWDDLTLGFNDPQPPQPIPEPGTVWLSASGLMLIVTAARCRGRVSA